MGDYIASIIVRLVNKIFALLPIRMLLWVGRRIGTLAFMVNRKRRVIAYANLKAAFAAEKSPAELRAITKRVYQNMAQTFVEVLNLTKVSKHYVDRYVDVIPMSQIENAARSGRGTILLTAHFGDWELSSLVSAIKGFPILVLAREQKMKRLNELLNQLRESKGCTVIRKGMPTKHIIRMLRSGGIVGILSDQDAGKAGHFVNFFGRPTSSHTGAFEMAQHMDAIILPNFIVRTNGPQHKLYLEEYIDFRDIPPGPDALHTALQRFTDLLEKYIRRYPDQWLWLHKRWKSTPTRTILILDDGKAGHLNQSRAVAYQIQRARMTQGYRLDDTKIITVPVAYKSAFHRMALTLAASFATWRCHGRMRLMRWCLTDECYRALMATYAEFIVSCGSSSAGVNVFMAKENNARNVIVMKPNLVGGGYRQFSLAIVPAHDRVPRRANVVATRLAPNMIDPAALTAAGTALAHTISLTRSAVIGVCLGGDNPEFTLSPTIARTLLEQVSVWCEKNDAEMLVTTSRRTSAAVEAVVRELCLNQKRCKLCVIANTKNIDGGVAGIMALSSMIVVSGESISMVSEAITAGKPVIAVSLDKKTAHVTKHELMLRALADAGYLRITPAHELTAAIQSAMGGTTPPSPIDDAERIYEAARRLI